MARSKNLHQVTYKFDISNDTGDISQNRIFSSNSLIDVSNQLSSVLGRTVKQANSFRVVGWGAAIRPAVTPGMDPSPDTGMGCSVLLDYTPTTRGSTAGWRDLKNHYWSQSKFRKGLGVNTRYDEFEVCHFESQINSRTSKVYVGGINDPTPESCTIYGTYDDEDGLGDGYIAAKHLYDAKHPVPAAGQLVETDFLFDDTIDYKPAKFGSYFPNMQTLHASATHSSPLFYDHDIGMDEIYTSGGVASDSIHWLPEGNHIDVLCGLFTARAFVTSPDDENLWADGAHLTVTIFIEGWSSINKALPSRSRSSKTRGKYYGKKRYYRRKRK